jgi:hypothetical protein
MLLFFHAFGGSDAVANISGSGCSTAFAFMLLFFYGSGSSDAFAIFSWIHFFPGSSLLFFPSSSGCTDVEIFS